MPRSSASRLTNPSQCGCGLFPAKNDDHNPCSRCMWKSGLVCSVELPCEVCKEWPAQRWVDYNARHQTWVLKQERLAVEAARTKELKKLARKQAKSCKSTSSRLSGISTSHSVGVAASTRSPPPPTDLQALGPLTNQRRKRIFNGFHRSLPGTASGDTVHRSSLATVRPHLPPGLP